MRRVIVYGLGKDFKKHFFFLQNEFEIIAFTDKNSKKIVGLNNGVELSDIKSLKYDYIFVTSELYFQEIKKDLVELYGVAAEKILAPTSMWWSVHNRDGRDNWVKERLLAIPEGYSILDAGAGNCRYKEYCRHLEYVSQDFGQYDSVERKEGVIGTEKWESRKCDILCDIASIPVDDNSFDYVLCTEVLEHVKNPIDVINEFGRIVKRGGGLILTAPFCSLTHMAPFYYTNGFSKYWYMDILSDAGFKVNEITPRGNYFYYLAQELQRVTEMAERFGEELSESEKKSIYDATKIMIHQAESEKKHDEVLCFGYMICAEKR